MKLLIIFIVSVISLTASFPFNKADSIHRLNDTIIPIHYDIEITPYFYADNEFGKEQYTFDGIVSIKIEAMKMNTKQLRLHTLDLDVLKIFISPTSDEGSSRQILTNYSHDSQTEILTIVCDNEILKDMSYILTIEYTGKMEPNLPGFYTGSFYLEGGEMIYGGTHSQPTYARKIFPCFDEPAFKASFQLTIIKPKEYSAYSNTEFIDVTNIPNINTYDKIKFKPTPSMSTYLLAFVIGRFTKVSTYVDESERDSFGLIIRPDMLELAYYSLNTGQQIILAMGEYLDYYYYDMVTTEEPIRKLDIVALPDFGGTAMENWGLVIGREDLLLYRERFTSLYNQQKIFHVLAHEITHQWFGNLVTCKWWSDTWMNEGFATYFQYYIGYELHPLWELEKQFQVEIVQLALLADSNINSKPLTRRVESQADSTASFDSISYNKGAAFLRMVYHLLGEVQFRNALKRYIKLHKYSTTTPDDLFKIWISEAEDNLDYITLFKTWTTQNNYPLVTVTYNANTKEALVSQKTFRLESMNLPSDQLWHIPLTFSKGTDTFLDSEVKTIMTTDSVTIPIDTENSWLIFNIRQVGFYRVNYDTNNWNLIRRALLSDNHGGIPEENRAQIVDDLFNLALASEISYEFAFSILEYLKIEKNYLPWYSAFASFSFLLSKMDDNQRADFKGYILKLLNESFKEVGWLKSDEDDSTLKIYHRANVLNWLTKFRHQNSMLQSKSLYDVYKADQSFEIHVDIRSLVFCSGVRNGDVYDVLFMWSKYLSENDPSLKQTMLGAIVCASKQEAIYLALDNILSTAMPDQDRQHIFSLSYSQTEENVQHVLDYYIKYHDKVRTGFREQSSVIIRVLVSLSTKFTKVNQIEQMEKFYEDNKSSYEQYGTMIYDALATARQNIEWNQANLPNILRMIKVNYRLDEAIIPQRYDLKIIPYITSKNEFNRDQFTFDGVVKIHLVPEISGQKSLRLNLKDLYITKMTIVEGNNGASDILVISSMHDTDTEIVTLVFDKELKMDQKYILTIEYNGYIRDDMRGFYRSRYKENGNEKWMFSTKFQPTMARLAFPCFDEPHYKATFSLTIVKPVEYLVYSNTQPKNTEDYSETYDQVEFKETSKMSAYLLSFVIAEFTSRSETTNEKFGIIARPDQYDQTSYALLNGWRVLEAMGNYLDYDYFDMETIDGQLDKIQMIAVPDLINDVSEHWGLISYRESNLLYDQEFTTLKDEQRIIMMISRAVAQLWFGNLVTCHWWDYLWLNGGFGNFFQYYLTALIETTWELEGQYVIDVVQPALLLDSEHNIHPLNGNVNTPLETSEIFDLISYNKGGSILRMIQHLIGKTKFATALGLYVKKYEYQTVNPGLLLNELHGIASDKYPKLYDMIEPWILQSNYPVIYVDFDPTYKQVTVSQKEFLLDPLKTRSDKKWHIPLTWTAKGEGFSETTPKHMLSLKSTNFAIETTNSWVIFNIQQTGFYRVNYDTNNWAMIKEALLSPDHDGIHEINRAQIIDDLFNFARAEELSWEFVFSMLDYLKTEIHYIPWAAVFRNLEFLENKIGENDDFRDYLRKLLNATYLATGFTETSSDNQLTIFHRSNILRWFCKIMDLDSILYSRDLFLEFKKGNQKIPVNIREQVYCCAMRYGDLEDFDFLWDKFETETIQTEQNAILNGLTCAIEKEILDKVLDKILSPMVRDQDKFPAIIKTFTETPTNLGNVQTYLLKNFENIRSCFKNDLKIFSSIFMYITLKFTTGKQISNMEDYLLEFYESFGEYFYTALDNLSIAEANVKWSSTNVPKILSQIAENLKINEETDPEGSGEGGDEENSQEENHEKDDDDGGSITQKTNILLWACFTIIFFYYF